MNSRERVTAAINHQPHDHIPNGFGSTTAACIHACAYRKLRKALSLPLKPVRIYDYMQMIAETDDEVRKKINADTVGIGLGIRYLESGRIYGWQKWTMSDGTEVEIPKNLDFHTQTNNEIKLFVNGEHKYNMPSNGFYFDPVNYAQWRIYDPNLITDEIIADVKTQARYYHENTDLAVVLNLPFSLFNSSSPDFLCALLTEKEKSHKKLAQWSDAIIKCVDKIIDEVKDYISVITFTGDVGTQKSPLISPELYHEMILPHFKKIPDFIHNKSDMKVFYHTCGSVYQLIECFIEMGIDILNPIQISAAGMEPERLISKFAGRIVFWGGGCDTQQVLSKGDEDDIRFNVRNNLSVFSRINGYLFAPDHNIQYDVPAPNTLAMFDALKKFNESVRVISYRERV